MSGKREKLQSIDSLVCFCCVDCTNEIGPENGNAVDMLGPQLSTREVKEVTIPSDYNSSCFSNLLTLDQVG